ncbi:MAG: hypothetical protein KatS3mg085_350 [Candidatus Dojkabacteria bacterium]|nr:MAG: hypothetical protein KatS3mg085_350 [Candidatus Dojkabacteria bacterium]
MIKTKILILLVLINFFSFNLYKLYQIESFKNDNFEIKFLDAGQGDSILIKTPLNHLVLIDTGKENIALKNLNKAIPYIKYIDLVIITHADSDHFENLSNILSRYSVGKIFINHTTKSNDYIKLLKNKLNKQNIYGLDSSNDFYFDKVFFDVVWPNSPYAELVENLDSNDASISILINYKNFKIFTAGDLGNNYENLLVDKLGKINVLKASHHGSLTSTSETFVENINPDFVIISAGANNQYNHPHPDVIKNISKVTKNIFDTSKHGTIKFIVK